MIVPRLFAGVALLMQFDARISEAIVGILLGFEWRIRMCYNFAVNDVPLYEVTATSKASQVA